MQTIGLIGTGLMGSGMARSLMRKGHRVLAYNRTRSRTASVAEAGARVVDTPAAVAAEADAIVAMLTDVRALRVVLDDGLQAGLRPGTFLIDCSTAAPEESRALAAVLADQGVTMLDAPVFGSKDSAEAGELTFLVGGPAEAYETCRPIFAAMGSKALHIGENGHGCYAKLGFNMVIAGTLEVFAEALALTGAAGVDARAMVDVILAGRARSGIIEMKAPRMLARDFTPFFMLKHMKKDLDLMVGAGRELGVSLPVTAAVQRTFAAAQASGLGEQDFCAVLDHLTGTGVAANE